MCTCGSGGPNMFESFDGRVLHFSGECQYRLSSYSDQQTTCSYVVDIVNKRTKNTYLIVKLMDMDIRLFQKQLVRVLT